MSDERSLEIVAHLHLLENDEQRILGSIQDENDNKKKCVHLGSMILQMGTNHPPGVFFESILERGVTSKIGVSKNTPIKSNSQLFNSARSHTTSFTPSWRLRLYYSRWPPYIRYNHSRYWLHIQQGKPFPVKPPLKTQGSSKGPVFEIRQGYVTDTKCTLARGPPIPYIDLPTILHDRTRTYSHYSEHDRHPANIVQARAEAH